MERWLYLVLLLGEDEVGHAAEGHAELDDLALGGVLRDAAEVQHSARRAVDGRVDLDLKPASPYSQSTHRCLLSRVRTYCSSQYLVMQPLKWSLVVSACHILEACQ